MKIRVSVGRPLQFHHNNFVESIFFAGKMPGKEL